jgi:5-guanidino-2-oxopentanoate decarboxylase
MLNQRQAAASITRENVAAYTPKDVRDAVAAAFASFKVQRPRPAYLELPIDLLKEPCGEGWSPRTLPSPLPPSPKDVKEACSLIADARSPVLILGGGASGTGATAQRIAEQIGAIMLTTIAGKGVVSSRHPLCLGARMAQVQAKKLMQGADLIIAVGTEISETDLWEASIEFTGKIIRIDLDPDVLARPHASTLPMLADAELALHAIADALPPLDGKLRRSEAESFVRNYLAREPDSEDEIRAMLRKVLTVIRSALPQDAIIASDMTQIAYAANEIFDMDLPRSWIHPVGFGTLGFGLPAAIGAKLGCPARPVAAMMGDYGFQYTLNELGTAAELALNLPILLWNNDALGQIRDDMINKGIQPNAVTLRNPDFQALAKAYACHAEAPASLDALHGAIVAALKARGPTLIEMRPSIVQAAGRRR